MYKYLWIVLFPVLLIGNTYENWMRDLPASVKRRTLDDILLPGTHNSGMYQFILDDTIKSTSGIKAACVAGKSSGIKKILKAWSVTQSLNLYEQMQRGARYLDLRLAYHSKRDLFYITHTFTSITLDEALHQIKEFLVDHPQEVVVVAMKPDHIHEDGLASHHNEAIIKIRETLGSFIYPYPSHSTFVNAISLKQMVATNQRLVFFYKGEQDPVLWNGSRIYEFWKDEPTVEGKFAHLEKMFRQTSENKSHYYVVPITLTPDASTIIPSVIKGIFPCCPADSIKTLAENVQKKFPPFFQEHADDFKKISAVTQDYLSEEFVQQIVEFNRQ